jgi:hypothetical protein
MLYRMSPAFSSLRERDEFVLEHEELVRRIALNYRTVAKIARVDIDDVIQDAWLGLLLASETWNPEAWPDADHKYFLTLWIKATIRKGLSAAGHSPDVYQLGSSTGLFGAVVQLPDGCTFRVRSMQSRQGQVVWMVGVTEKPEQSKRNRGLGRNCRPARGPNRAPSS